MYQAILGNSDSTKLLAEPKPTTDHEMRQDAAKTVGDSQGRQYPGPADGAPDRKMSRSYLDTITALVYALEAKDQYICGHSHRVAKIATAIAQELGLPPQRVDQIGLAGLIHDIGKIGVREAVLNKPGRLTEEEYQHVISHCEIGERILRPVVEDEDVLDMVRHHHERYDGTGYPDGLSGVQPPFTGGTLAGAEAYNYVTTRLSEGKTLSQNAAILAVADAYDAIMSARSYRAAFTREEAEAELRRGAGSQFDPETVAALLRISNSLAPLFEDARKVTRREARRAAMERAKREAEEARKAKEAEKRAKKEAKEAEKRAKKEAKEAEKRAKKEAKERAKREAEEAKKAEEAEKRASKEARETEKQARHETKRAAEGKAKGKVEETKPAVKDNGSGVYQGNVKLVVPSTVSSEQERQFKERLEQVEELRILWTAGSVDEDITIAVSVQKPLNLIGILKEMPVVEAVDKQGEKLVVMLKKPTAG
jgi:putative nucleotidyltransferase with HDIG domain